MTDAARLAREEGYADRIAGDEDAILPERMRMFERLMALRPGERVLDLGSGRGVFSRKAAELGGRVTALDFSLRYLAGVRGAARVAGTADALPFADGSFDLVIFIEVLEHIPSEEEPAVLAELHRVLRPGGRLLLHTPNGACRGAYAALARWWPGFKRSYLYRAVFDPETERVHVNLQDPAVLNQRLAKAGFRGRVRAYDLRFRPARLWSRLNALPLDRLPGLGRRLGLCIRGVLRKPTSARGRTAG